MLIHYSIPPELIPLTITLLEALCLISPLPFLLSLLGKDALLINYHFYGTTYLLNIKQISNPLEFKTTLKNHLLSSWLNVWLWHQWLITLTVDCWLSWVHLLARLQCILGPSSSMGVFFSFKFCHCFVLVNTAYFVILHCKWYLMKIYKQKTFSCNVLFIYFL